MTIECRETVYGRPHGSPKEVEPGTSEWLYFNSLNMYRTAVGTALRVDSDYRVTVLRYLGLGVGFMEVLTRDKINEENLKTSPTTYFKDLLLWRRRHYYWKPNPGETSPEPGTKTINPLK